MKKNILLGILLLVFSITLIGCTKESNNDQFNGTDIKEIGLKVEAKTIGSTGLTLVFNQYDLSLPKGELEFGEEYYIEKKNDEGEYSLIHTLGYIDYAWNEIAYIIKNGEITEHEVDWTWLYGNLPNGEYRLHKKIMDFIETGKYEEYDVYVYFTLENIPSSADEERIDPEDETKKELCIETVFRGIVKRIEEESIILEPEGNEVKFICAIPIKNMPASPEPVVGDIVEIVYDGSIEETHPAKLGHLGNIQTVRIIRK